MEEVPLTNCGFDNFSLSCAGGLCRGMMAVTSISGGFPIGPARLLFRPSPPRRLPFPAAPTRRFCCGAPSAGAHSPRPTMSKPRFRPTPKMQTPNSWRSPFRSLCGWIRLDALAQDGVAANGPRRCYFCKKAIFTAILSQAARRRPAASCWRVPTLPTMWTTGPAGRHCRNWGSCRRCGLCGLTKPELRRLSREAGLPTWDKPAAACLATRIPTHTPITAAALDRGGPCRGGGWRRWASPTSGCG